MTCNCAYWRDNIEKVTGPMTLQTFRSGFRYQYDGAVFRYCPWCGKGLVEDEAAGDHPMSSEQPKPHRDDVCARCHHIYLEHTTDGGICTYSGCECNEFERAGDTVQSPGVPDAPPPLPEDLAARVANFRLKAERLAALSADDWFLPT